MMLQQRQLQQARQTFGPACRPHASRRPTKRLAVAIRAEQVLIVNTKGGGHAFIGLHLAKALLKNGHSITIFNDGDQASPSTGSAADVASADQALPLSWPLQS